ncbi:MAG: hypothetical protein ACK55I_12920, partial [bacterium]
LPDRRSAVGDGLQADLAHHVEDVPAGELMPCGDGLQIHLQPGLRREGFPPEAQPLRRARLGEVHHAFEAPQEGAIQVGRQVGGQDHHPGKGFQPLQQEGHLLVGV